jgi:sugar phosphate isomerase/epimerase
MNMKIGVRQVGKLPFPDFCLWLRDHGFEAVDVGEISAEARQAADAAGLVIGTANVQTRDLMNVDPIQRQAGIENCKNTIRKAVDYGVGLLFCVFVPPDPSKGRAANFELWKEGFAPVAEFAESTGVRIVMEGWPGGPPYYPSLGCTPEMWRAMFAAIPSPAFGLNYDPSHLVRLGIDHIRALHEFADRVYHVHAKDTALDAERLYEHGNLGPVFHGARGFGEDWWRYTIPGDGVVNWARVVERLEDAGYDGIVSVELEDYRYWKDWDAQAEGLIRSRERLAEVVR